MFLAQRNLFIQTAQEIKILYKIYRTKILCYLNQFQQKSLIFLSFVYFLVKSRESVL